MRKAKSNGKRKSANERSIHLRLYVAGQTPKSLAALSNLKRICTEHLSGNYTVEVIDLIKNPQLAQSDQILAIPTLVRNLPKPIRKIIGDLSNADRVVIGLNLAEGGTAGAAREAVAVKALGAKS